MLKIWLIKITHTPAITMKIITDRARYLLLLLLVPLLVSCTTGFFYNNLDRISLWYINDYVSLTRKQREEYNWRFNDLQRWHREYELNNYRQFLSAIDQQIAAQHLSAADIEQAVTTYHQEARVLWVNLVLKASPHLHQLILQLSRQQKQELISSLVAKNRSHFIEIQALSDRERQQRKIKRLKKNLSRWMGSFTREQEQMIEQWAKDLHPLDQGHYQFRQQWLSELRKTLRLPEAESEKRLELQLAHRETFMTPEYRRQLEENRQLTEKLIAGLLITRTTRQQRVLVREISGWLKLIGRMTRT